MHLKNYQPFRSIALVLILSGLLLLTACGTFEINVAVPTSSTAPLEDESLQNPTMQIITQIVTPLTIEDGAPQSTATLTPVTPDENSGADNNQPISDPDGSLLWVEVIDERTGVRFAMPCFWIADIPSGEQDPSGLGSFPIKNYTEEFVMSFGPKQGDLIWENGAIKIDISYVRGEQLGLPSGTSLREFVQGLNRGEGEGIEAIEEVTINGQPALLVTTHNSMYERTNQSYNFALPDDIFLIFSVHPNSENFHADVQGILQSLALTPDVNIQMPNFIPRQPPEGMPAACMKGIGQPDEQQDITGPGACQSVETNSAAAVACDIQNALLTRNMAALETLMTNPFTIGYWQSEGRIGSPAESTKELDQYRLPADTSGLTFTVDREQFPYMYGIPPENMFGPDLNVDLVVYSQGWGQDGQDEAMLLIAENANGEYYWHGMIYAGQGFER